MPNHLLFSPLSPLLFPKCVCGGGGVTRIRTFSGFACHNIHSIHFPFTTAEEGSIFLFPAIHRKRGGGEYHASLACRNSHSTQSPITTAEEDGTSLTHARYLVVLGELVSVRRGHVDDLGSRREILSDSPVIPAVLVQSDELRDFVVLVNQLDDDARVVVQGIGRAVLEEQKGKSIEDAKTKQRRQATIKDNAVPK